MLQMVGLVRPRKPWEQGARKLPEWKTKAEFHAFKHSLPSFLHWQEARGRGDCFTGSNNQLVHFRFRRIRTWPESPIPRTCSSTKFLTCLRLEMTTMCLYLFLFLFFCVGLIEFRSSLIRLINY